MIPGWPMYYVISFADEVAILSMEICRVTLLLSKGMLSSRVFLVSGIRVCDTKLTSSHDLFSRCVHV